MTFPDDENGDVLRRIQAGGGDFTKPRDIDFTVVFPDQSSAEGFASEIRPLGHFVEMRETHTADGLPWDVRITKNMKLSHQEIRDFEILLEDIAIKFGGRNDGWGCLTDPLLPNTKLN